MDSKLEKQKNFISAIIYLRNNEETIERFMLGIDEYLNNNFTAYEYVIVNNLSNDHSIEIIKNIKKKISGKVTIVNLAWKHSRERAMIAGQAISIGDYVYEFDNSILDFDIDELDCCYKKCLSGFDIVNAINSRKIGILKKIYSRLTKSDVDADISFRIISRRAINRIYKNIGSFLYRKYAYNMVGFDVYLHCFNGSVDSLKIRESKVDSLREKLSALMKYTKFNLIYGLISMIILIIFGILSIVLKNTCYIFIPLLFQIALTSILLLNLISDIYNEISRVPLFVFKSVDRL